MSSAFLTAATLEASSFVAVQELFRSAAAHAVRTPKPVSTPHPTKPGIQVGAAPGASGLVAQYFQGSALQHLALTRTDPTIDFTWPGTPDPAITNGPFSVRWTGKVVAGAGGVYTFGVRSNAGVRLWVKGKQLVNHWKTHKLKTDSAKIRLAAGVGYDIRLEFFENIASSSTVQLLWSSAGKVAAPIAAASLAAQPLLNPGAAPAAPASLTAQISSATQVHLTWAAAAKASTYTVLRSEDGTRFTSIGTTTATHTTFDDTTVVAATQYYYEVCTINAKGTSLPSPFASAVTTLGTPGNLSAAAFSQSQINLAWNDVAGETGFQVFASTDGGIHYGLLGTTGASSAAYQATGLLPGTQYTFEVVATSASGNSPPSNVANATTLTVAPQGLSVSATSPSQNTLSWSDVAHETGFVIERSSNGLSGWAQVGATLAGVTQAVDSGLTPATTYFYRVRATDAGGNSNPSNLSGATTPAVAGPRYEYVTEQSSYSGTVGTPITVRVYLEEILIAGDTSIIASDGGLASFSATISELAADTPTAPATITGASGNVADFPTFSGSPFTHFAAGNGVISGAMGISSPTGAMPGNTGGGASPSIANEVYLGSFVITPGASGSTTFVVGALNAPNGGNTNTRQNVYDMDVTQSAAPAYTGVGITQSLFTVTTLP
jgi:fibronectin type 3 domain-containing protein